MERSWEELPGEGRGALDPRPFDVRVAGETSPRLSAESPAAAPRRTSAPPLDWRLLRDPPLPGPRNMALDHALAACLQQGEAVLRLYGWSRPTVSFGRNEPARVLYSRPPGEQGDEREAEAAPALDHVRRPTGGRAVVHWRELTYAVIAPLDAWGGLRAAYVAINEGLGGALRRLGVPVELAGPPAGAPALRPDAGPCFRQPAPGEVTVAGRKLVGSAQARLEGALLQHGSILVDDDQGLLGGGDRPASLRELVGDVSIDELTDVVAMSLRETFGGTWMAGGAPAGYRPRELEAAERLESERYARDSWTWRR